MRQNDINIYFRTFMIWLLPGLFAGILSAAAVTFQEYRSFSEFTGAVIEQDKKALEMRNQKADGEETKIQELFSYALKKRNPDDRKTGERWLHGYGYRTWNRLETHIYYLSAICILLSELTGWSIFRRRRQEEYKRKQRIEELTEYLLAANRGEAYALCRREDVFSCLEDEIYKTVMELKSTKEEAVHNHEVLSARIADIAHQLKTPITSMSLMTELLEEQQTKEGEECLQRLNLQIRRLQNLVSALLSMAKLESHAIRFHTEEVDIKDMIEETAGELEGLISKKGIRLVTSGGEVSIQADRQWTEEAMLNVLKNCAEHSPAGSVIQIRWEENPLYTEIRFTDCGKGFAKKDLPHLFERFYRGEDAQKDSAGIGLALAKLVVDQQNGHVYAENTIDGHASFIIRFYP